jgi:hypothetical protein
MRLDKGADFSADDVEAAADRTIQVAARADGILVGGMSYQLDPTLKPWRPGRPGPGEHGHEHDDDCGCAVDVKADSMAEDLLRYLNRRKQRVREVEVRKIVVEIELEDCDD